MCADGAIHLAIIVSTMYFVLIACCLKTSCFVAGSRACCVTAAANTWPPPVQHQLDDLPALGETPTALSKLKALNRVNPLDWLQGSSLASSAADNRNSFHSTAQRSSRGSSVAQTPAAGRPSGNRSSFSFAKTPRGLSAQSVVWNSTRLLAND